MRFGSTMVALIGVAAITGCGSTSTLAGKSVTAATARPVTVENPQFSPAPGSYSTAQTITISDATAGATIYYTTDGTAPTANSKQYTGPLTISGSQVIEAMAAMPQATPSAVLTASYNIVPPVVTASTSSFDFGDDLVNTVLTKTVGTVTNDGPTAAPVALTMSGDASFSLVPGQSCGSQIAANATCALVVAYNPAKAGVQTGAVNVQFTGGTTAPTSISLTGTAAAIGAGTVTPTNNPQVASYSITPPFGATVSVQFGKTKDYGFNTSSKATPTDGGPVNILVAGMLANTVYHMQATVVLENGTTYQDVDHTFTTGAVPAGLAPVMTVTQTPGLTAQPGIEFIDNVLGGVKSAVVATDLSGNVIWTYSAPDLQPGTFVTPIKQMANGDLISAVAPLSGGFVPPAPGVPNFLREVDLAGNTVRQMSMDQLNSRLAAAGFTGLNLIVFHHEVTPLPNGHTLILSNIVRPYTNVTGYPGVTNVLGDVVVDLDADWNPVWVWNEFDHFDVNRHMMSFPDWTHSNAIIYSADDGNFLISVRHQNWVVKVNYKDGAGDGSVIWKLGPGGDFTLKGGTAPQDWFYAQHNPAFFTANTTGVFSLSLMDNGDDRVLADGTNCLTTVASCYTTIPVMQVDENAKTATLTFQQKLPNNLYSFFGGSVDQLANTNVEYNLAGVGHDSYIFEVTQTATPQTVWEMKITGTNSYRAFRASSLYPGVQW